MTDRESDRELLELAAKAAGIRLHVWGTPNCENFADLDTGNRWNPITDDGDALRLAVRLEIAVNPYAGKTVVAHTESGRSAHEEWDCHDDDPYAATRRAIVRAAAEIGKEQR